MSTTLVRKEDVQRKWYVLDAADKPLGRTAVIAANILRGKTKPDFTPNVDCGDYVIIVNVDKAILTGKKLEQKYYRRHSGWIGGLKETKYKTIMAALSRANLVESAVGKSGGYRLTRSPEDYPVGEILRAVEGNLSPIACQSEDGSGCGASCDCDARLFWQGLEDQINSYVDNHTLAQFMRVNEKTPAVLNGTERR